MAELPRGWAVASLRDVSLINPKHSRETNLDTIVSFVPMQAVSESGWSFLRTEERRYSEVRKGYTHFAEGDVLLAKITPCFENGKAAIARELRNGLGCGTTELHVLRPLSCILPEYLYRYLHQESFRHSAVHHMTGTAGQLRVPVSHIEQVRLPLPPLPEQRRIVAKLEELLGKVDACQKRLERVSIVLKRFRQSVLAAACSGRLTEDWRLSNPDAGSGNDLLKRINQFLMAQSLKPKELQQVEGVVEIGSVLDTLGLEDVPGTWAPCNVGKVGRVCNGSTPSRKIPSYWSGEVPWVSSGEVRNNIITVTRERISHRGLAESSLKLLPKGTVLLAMIGEGKTRGQSAVLEIESTINQNIAAIVIDHDFVKPKFLWLWFQQQYSRTREVGSGSGPQALNCERVRELPFLLPGLAEQTEIVRRVESLFKLADQIATRYNVAKDSTDQLTQSMLAKAFCGELVPQDARDEPAEALLRRAKKDAEKSASKNSPNRNGITRKIHKLTAPRAPVLAGAKSRK